MIRIPNNSKKTIHSKEIGKLRRFGCLFFMGFFASQFPEWRKEFSVLFLTAMEKTTQKNSNLILREFIIFQFK